MNKIIFFILIVFNINCFSKTIKIAIIDTGFDFNSNWLDYKKENLKSLPVLCKGFIHKNFSNDKSIQDINSHGTHIAGIIANQINYNVNYCLVIIKYFGLNQNNQYNMNKAILYAIQQKVDIINISAGGTYIDKQEQFLIELAINRNIVVIAASGNEHMLMEDKKSCKYYPGCYNKVMNVGNLGNKTSNYGKMVKIVIDGNNIKSLLPNNKYGYMSGTSQSTAIQTGNIVNKLWRK